MFVPIEYNLSNLVTSHEYNSKEKLQCVHAVEYFDDGCSRQLPALARNPGDVQKELIVGTVKEYGEKVTVKDNRVAVLVREGRRKGGSAFIV